MPAIRLCGTDEGSRALTALSDHELLEGLKKASEPHFNELYRRYFDRIYAYVQNRMRNHADTEELVQDTFTAAFNSLDGYRGQSSLLSWVYGIAKNTVNNHIRRSIAVEQRIERAEDAQMLGPLPSFSTGTPEDQLCLRRYADAIEEHLGSIPSWQTEIFVMRHMQDLSIPEITERTSRSSDAVRSSLYRVKKLLMEAAEDGNGFSTGAGKGQW